MSLSERREEGEEKVSREAETRNRKIQKNKNKIHFAQNISVSHFKTEQAKVKKRRKEKNPEKEEESEKKNRSLPRPTARR
jgi:hypothetical protein